ncbi:MAG: metallophosphoesterase [Chloroflexota bacterium]|nr:metallophosphoesterase [Chloroflexota bacterium]
MPTRRQFLLGACGGLAAVAAPAAWFGAVYEPGDIEVVRRTAQIKNLPSRLNGLTAVQISDLHLDRASDAHQHMIDLIKGLKPDVIFFTGDLVDDRLATGHAVDIFRQLDPPRGIWAVPGNWDHTADAVGTLQLDLGAAKVRFLINESAELDAGFWIVGVDDPATSMDEVSTALQNIPAREPRLMLAHAPDIADNIVDAPAFDLILVGHTHGGQVNLPLFNGAWLKSGASAEYTRGLYQVHGSPMYVNRGIGMTTVPVRIGSRPEITHFTFHAA